MQTWKRELVVKCMRFRKAKTTWIQGRFVDTTTGELYKVDRRAFNYLIIKCVAFRIRSTKSCVDDPREQWQKSNCRST